MTTALKARIMANLSKNTSKANTTQANVTQAIVPPIEAESAPLVEAESTTPVEAESTIPVEAESTTPVEVESTTPVEAESATFVEPTPFGLSTLANDTPDDRQPPPSSDPLDYDMSDGMSYTSTLPDVFEVGMDDSAPSATGPWTIVDHFTGEMIVDDEEVGPSVPSDPGPTIETEIIMGVPTLVQTSRPTLLFVDQDERSDWLIRSTSEFLQHVPYYMCLNKVVDLFFTQEARLGHPEKVSASYFLLCPLVDNLFH